MSEFQSRMVALLAARDRVMHAASEHDRSIAETAFNEAVEAMRSNADNPEVASLLRELNRQIRIRTSAS